MSVAEWSGTSLPWFEELAALKGRMGGLFRRAGDAQRTASRADASQSALATWKGLCLPCGKPSFSRVRLALRAMAIARGDAGRATGLARFVMANAVKLAQETNEISSTYSASRAQNGLDFGKFPVHFAVSREYAARDAFGGTASATRQVDAKQCAGTREAAGGVRQGSGSSLGRALTYITPAGGAAS